MKDDRHEVERRDRAQRQIMAMIAADRPLAECLTALTEVAAHLDHGVRACVLLASEDRTTIAETFSAQLPPSFGAAIRDASIHAPRSGTCGTALQTGTTVTCADVQSTDQWSDAWQAACLAHGIRACHSTPAFGAGPAGDGAPPVVAAFVLGLPEPREPSGAEQRLAEFAAQAAGIVIERDRSAARLREELRATSRLQELGATLARHDELEPLLQQILVAAADLTGTEKGNIQLYDPDRGRLRIVVSVGLGRRLVEHFADDGWVATCARAAGQAQRVIVEDVQALEHLRGTVELEIVVEDGIRSIQSTPLLSREGRLLGMLNNHYRQPGGPDQRTLRYIDLLARQAADLIERHQAEEARRASEARLRTLVERSPFGTYVVDADFRIVMMNTSGQQGAFVNVRPVIGRRFDDAMRILWPEEVALDIIQVFRRTLETGEPYFSRDFVSPRADTTRIEGYEWELHPITMAGGTRGVICYYFDSTSLRETERRLSDAVGALERSAEATTFLGELSDLVARRDDPDALMAGAGAKLAAHLQLASVQFGEVDDDRGVTRVAYGWYGPDVISLVGGEYRHADYVLPDLLEAHRRGEVLAIGDTAKDPRARAEAYRSIGIRAFVTVPFHDDGRWRFILAVTDTQPRDWREHEVALVREAAGRIFPGLERARAEAALRESEERFRLAQMGGGVGVWDWSKRTDVTYWSDTMWALHGRQPATTPTAIPEVWRDSLHPDDRPRVLEHLAASLASAAVEFRDEFRIVRPDGSPRWLENVARIERDVDGQACRMYGVNTDVTARRHAEQALRDSEAALWQRSQELQTIYDTSPVGMCLLDRELRFLRINDRLAEMNGLPAADHLGRTVREMVPLLADQLEPAFRRVIDSGEPAIDVELRGETSARPGVERVWLESWYPQRDGDGQVVGVNVVAQEVTDRKRAEDALRESEARFRLMVESARDFAIITTDLQGVVTGWNVGAENLLGYAEHEAVGRHGGFIFVPEDLARGVDRRELESAMATGRATNERWHVRKDGTRFWGSGLVTQLKYEGDDQPRGLIKIMRDRTAARAAEQRIADDLAAITLLQETGALCARPDADAVECLQAVLDAAIRLAGAAKGNVQLLDAASGTLRIAVQRGFDRPFLDFFAVVAAGDAATCGVALTGAARVVVPDVMQSAIFAGQPSLEVLLAEGVRAVVSTPLVSTDGRVMGIISTHHAQPHATDDRSLSLMDVLARQAADYLQRTRSVAALRASERRFRSLAAATAQIVWTTDPDGRVIEDSPSWREFTGQTVEQWTADGFDPVHPEDRDRVQAEWRRAVAGRAPCSLEYRLRRHDGEFRLVVVRGVPVLDDDGGGVREWVGTISDVTEQRRAEEALRVQQRQLQEADRKKDEFLAMLAHELRNPLAPIRTGLELMRLAGDTPESVGRVRSMMERQIGHMVRLIDDLLDVSRITSGKIRLQRSPQPLSELVAGAVEANRALIAAGQLDLAVRLPEPSPVLHVDPTRFVQVLANLLHNAAKFTPANGRVEVVAELATRPGEASRELQVRVVDTGVGIPEQMLPRVFDLFTQGEQPTERAHGGLGIGLALAQRLIELHGGTIEAQSAGRGHGSEFLIRLPLEDPAPGGAGPAAHAQMPKVARRVVIIDDNLDAAETLAWLVGAAGGQARTAHDGTTGIEAVREFQPDVVLLDIGMPGIDGYETCRRLRRESYGQRIVVVALTGWGQEQDRQRALGAGFDAHLTKPADPAALLKLLAEVSRR